MSVIITLSSVYSTGEVNTAIDEIDNNLVGIYGTGILNVFIVTSIHCTGTLGSISIEIDEGIVGIAGTAVVGVPVAS